MRKIFMGYIILSAAYALVSIIIPTFPASFFTEGIREDDRLAMGIAFILTLLILWLPVYIPLFVYNLFVHKNKVPADLSGLTGIIIRREFAMPDAMFPFSIVLNNQVKDKIGNRKSVFVELKPGSYQLQIKSGSKYSLPKEINVDAGKVKIYSASVNKEVARRIPVKNENFIAVNTSF